MINLLFEPLPNYIEINGERYPIKTDFRAWIALNEALLDPDALPMITEIMLSMFTGERPLVSNEMIRSVTSFLSGQHYETKSTKGIKRKSKYVFSYTYDCDYLIGAFQSCYGIDLLSIKHLHWWHFNALFNALNSDCQLMQRIAYRSTKLSDIKDRKERERIRKIQSQIALPTIEMSEENIADVFF